MNDPTDEQIEHFLDTITRPMFNWRMGRARAVRYPGNPPADSPMKRSGETARRRALQEIRQALYDLQQDSC